MEYSQLQKKWNKQQYQFIDNNITFTSNSQLSENQNNQKIKIKKDEHQEIECCKECKIFISQCWQTCCSCCYTIFRPNFFDGQKQKAAQYRQSNYKVYVFFYGLYNHFSSVSLQIQNPIFNNQDNDEKQFQYFILKKITDNLAYIEFQYERFKIFKVEVSNKIGLVSISEKFEYNQKNYLPNLINQQNNCQNFHPIFLLPEQFTPSNCIPYFRNIKNSQKQEEIDKFIMIVQQLIEISNFQILKIWDLKQNYIDQMKYMKTYLENKSFFQQFPAQIKIKFASILIDKDQKEEDNVKNLKLIGKIQMYKLDQIEFIENDYAERIIEYFRNFNLNNYEQDAIIGLMVVFSNCKSLNSLLYLKFKDKLINQWPDSQIDIMNIIKKNQFDIYQVGKYLAENNLFKYLSISERTALEKEALQIRQQNLQSTLQFCQTFEYNLKEDFWYNNILDKIQLISDWGDFFQFWNNNRKLILGTELPEMIINCFEKFINQQQLQYLNENDILTNYIAIIDTLSITKEFFPSSKSKQIQDDLIKKIQKIIGQQLQIKECQPQKQTNTHFDQQNVNIKSVKENQIDQQIIEELQFQAQDPLLVLDDYITFLNTLSQHQSGQVEYLNYIIDYIFTLINQIIQSYDILDVQFATSEILSRLKNIVSPNYQIQFKEIIQNKIDSDSQKLQKPDEFINLVTNQCFKKDFTFIKASFIGYYQIFLNILSKRNLNDLSIIVNKQIYHNVILSCKKNKKIIGNNLFYVTIENQIRQLYKDIQKHKIDINIAENFLYFYQWKNVYNIFTIFELRINQDWLKILTQKITQFVNWKKLMQTWYNFHKNSRQMPQFFKNFFCKDKEIQFLDLNNMVSEMQKYKISFQMMNKLKDCLVFTNLLNKYKNKLKNLHFQQVEQYLYEKIFLSFHSLCSIIFKFQNNSFKFNFKLDNSHPLMKIIKKFEKNSINSNKCNMQDQLYYTVNCKLINENFKIEEFNNLQELQLDLERMVVFYEDFLMNEKINFDLKFSQNIFIYIDIDNAKNKARCVKKIAKLFQIQNEKVSQYINFHDQCQQFNDETPLHTIINNYQQYNQFLKLIQKDLNNEELKYLMQFTSAKKTIKFIMDNQNIDFEEIFGWNEEADKNLEQNILLMSDYSKQVKQQFKKIKENQQKDIISLCKTISHETQLIMEKNPTFYHELSEINQYIVQIKNLIDGPQVKYEKVQTIIHKLLASGIYYIEVKLGTTTLYTIQDNEKLYSKDMTSIYARGFLVTMGTSNQSLQVDKDQQLKKVKKFKEQVELLQELKDIVDQLRLLGSFSFQDKKIEFDNRKGFKICMSNIRAQKVLFEQEMESWIQSLETSYKEYPTLTLIPQRLLINIKKLTQQQQLEPIEIEEINKLLKSILDKINYKQFKFKVDPPKVPQLPQAPLQDQEYLKKIGIFLSERIQIPFKKNLEQEPKIYVKKLHYGFENQIYQLLQQSFTLETKSYQYYFCDQNTTYHDIMLFIYRFLNLHINSSFYLIDFQNCNAYLREKIKQKLHQIIKLYSSNNKLILIILVNQSTDNIELQQYDEFLPQNKGQIPQQVKNKVHTYFSDYGGLGKSFQIKQDIGQKKSVRIPLHSTYSKIEKIQLIIQKLSQKKLKDKKSRKVIHLEITDTTDIHQINLILFEILFLRFINSNYQVFTTLSSSIDIYLEIQNTLNNFLSKNLKILDIFENRNNLIFDINKFKVKQKPTSKIQVVLRYLQALNRGTNINSRGACDFGQIYLQEPQNLPIIPQLEGVQILKNFFIVHHRNPTKKMNSPNYYTLMHFIRFLAKQFRGLDQQPIFNINDSEQAIYYFGSYNEAVELRFQLLQLLYDLGFEQACQSNGDLFNIQGHEIERMKNKSIQEQQEMIAKKVKPYKDLQQDFVAFSSDGIPICFYLKTQMPKTLQMAYQKIQEHIKNDDYQQPDLYSKDQFQLVKHLVKLCNDKPQLIIKNWQAQNFVDADMPENLKNEMQSLAISSDNLFKMALIYLRIISKTPTIAMGETGIGKTAVIKLLSYIMNNEFLTLDVHAGIDKKTIVETVLKAENQCQKTEHQVVLFFDEINTNKNISGLLKEILIDRRLEGKKIKKKILLLAACNPYKLKKNAFSTFTAGIKQNKLDEQNQQLVYRVEPMPQSMFYFIQNYDVLEDSDLKFYIRKIIEREELFLQDEIDNLIVQQVFYSQKFVNNVDTPQSCSLRDVVRFAKLTSWFQKVYFTRKKKALETQIVENTKLQSILLALAFCYHNRLQTEKMRAEYRQEMIQIYNQNKNKHQLKVATLRPKTDKNDMLFSMLEEEANFILDCINLPQDFGRNKALKENIFAMFICIFNKIPLFLTGPPGCSKTSSFNLIYKSLFKGSQNLNPFLKQFPSIRLRSYQGHLQSTSQNVERVFQDAIKLQQDCKNNNLDTIVVVFIDELGLAELSPHNPLKILHSILENPQVSVIGISNWTLDASKQNRALSMSRDFAGKADLIVTAESIVKTMNVSIPIDQIEKIVCVFLNLLQQTNTIINNFFGNRDFYNMIKYICSEWGNIDSPINVIVKGFFRNFSGYQQMDKILIKIIEQQFGIKNLQKPTILSLINENLTEKKDLYPTRHLMIFTDDEEGTIFYIENQFKQNCKVFFGSDFIEDKFEASTNNIINQIVVCIETGIPCIVINFESIYQSFYAVLNQNYIEIRGGDVKLCQIAYGYDKRNIQVHPQFKFVLIAKFADRKKLDPPLLNRFEKHEYTRQDILGEQDINLLKKLKVWTSIFTNKQNNMQQNNYIKNFNSFCCDDIEGILSSIITYNKDSIGSDATEEDLYSKCVSDMLWITHLGGVMLSQDDKIIEEYIQIHKHDNLFIFANWANKQCETQNLIYDSNDNCFNDWLTPFGFNSIIYTFQSTSDEQLRDQNMFDITFIHRSLETFKSEKDIDQFLEQFFTQKQVAQLLILSAEIYTNDTHERIILTRNIITQNRKKQKNGVRNVCFIIKMYKQTCELLRFNSQWKQVCLDNLYNCFMDPSSIFQDKNEVQYILSLLSLQSLIKKNQIRFYVIKF